MARRKMVMRTDAEKRKILAEVGAGVPVAKIAARLRITPGLIYAWIRKGEGRDYKRPGLKTVPVDRDRALRDAIVYLRHACKEHAGLKLGKEQHYVGLALILLEDLT